jgi:2-polyprenyl-3-methyl-5-hydroxy-6-metoxy-1,4-benzoquinol methylase
MNSESISSTAVRNDYVQSLQANREEARAYYTKSVQKTEQQKFLEQLLQEQGLSFKTIADIGCGGGTLSYHLSALYPEAEFYLADLNPDALELASELCRGPQFRIVQDDMYSLERLPHNHFDAVFSWQVLSWIDKPELALNRLLALLKPGGRIFLSSLFNLDHDVDIYAKLQDYTRADSRPATYNTYAARTVQGWLGGRVQELRFHPFVPGTDFSYEGRGLGTNTVASERGRLQISAGLLMNWAILEIIK